LVYSTKPTPSQTTMAAKSWWAWGGGCTKSAGFAAVCPQNHQVPWLSQKVKNEGSTGEDRIRACQEASRWGTHDVIARLASDGSKTAVDVCSLDGNIHFLAKVPLRGVYLLYG
jgi:hypothetical protein